MIPPFRFILKRRPCSVNNFRSHKKEQFLIFLDKTIQELPRQPEILSGNLYGKIYHFFRKDHRYDADNISKPIWDSLIGRLYEDDKQIKLRIAGLVGNDEAEMKEMDFTGLDGDFIKELLEAIDSEDHVLYIECGPLSPMMFTFDNNPR